MCIVDVYRKHLWRIVNASAREGFGFWIERRDQIRSGERIEWIQDRPANRHYHC